MLRVRHDRAALVVWVESRTLVGEWDTTHERVENVTMDDDLDQMSHDQLVAEAQDHARNAHDTEISAELILGLARPPQRRPPAPAPER